MKVKYKRTDRKDIAKLEKEFYKVLAYGEFNKKSKIFLLANDNLEIIEPDESVIEVIDYDLSEYDERLNLNFQRIFFIDKRLSKFVSHFDNYSQLKSEDIWNKSKISNFFTNDNFVIPENYRNTVLNSTYKLTLIQGFLMFVDTYINHKNTTDYKDGIYFYVAESFDTIIEQRFQDDIKVTDLDKAEYPTNFYNFIDKYLYDEKEKEEKSKSYCERLFKLIDSLFINEIGKTFLVETFYDEVFAIEYENKYYCLSKTWTS